MYIVGQERRLVDPPSQVVAGVRTVTTNMDGRDALPRMSRPFAFYQRLFCISGDRVSYRNAVGRVRVADQNSTPPRYDTDLMIWPQCTAWKSR